jgi:hypothetical protein
MYNYVRVILILYKPLGEEDEFLTLCFSPLNPKYLLRTRYSPHLYSLSASSYLVLSFRHTQMVSHHVMNDWFESPSVIGG